MRIIFYVKNIPVKINPDLIWNDEALGCFKKLDPQKIEEDDEQQYEISS